MRHRFEQGMTLMELLVALVIGSLVITLVVRGLGMSLNLYERVAEMTATLDIRFRERHWWTDSVASLVPCTDAAHCVQGDANSFRGYTLSNVLHTPGMRMPVVWRIARQDGEARLLLQEGVPNSTPNRAPNTAPAGVTLTLPLPGDARFGYLYPDGQWRTEWNTRGDNLRLPVAIRIEDDQGAVWALAAPIQRPYGRGDYRDIAGLQ